MSLGLSNCEIDSSRSLLTACDNVDDAHDAWYNADGGVWTRLGYPVVGFMYIIYMPVLRVPRARLPPTSFSVSNEHD